MVTFNLDGKTYRLEFERKKENVTLFKGKRERIVTSKYPFTTARLLRMVPSEAPTKILGVKVGCHTKDQYSHAEGRIQALKGLTKSLRVLYKDDPEFVVRLLTVMWDAYIGRIRPTLKADKAETIDVPATAVVLETETIH